MDYIGYTFGIANFITAILVIFMPYGRYGRTIPLVLVSLTTLSWLLYTVFDINDTAAHAVPFYLLIDTFILFLAHAGCFHHKGWWRVCLIGVTWLAVIIATIYYFFDHTMSKNQLGFTALAMNIIYGSQILLIIASAFEETFRRRKS